MEQHGKNKMKKIKIMFLICAAFLCSNAIMAQSPSQNQQQGQQNNNWQYMGKVNLEKPVQNEYSGVWSTGLLYASFNGEKIVYKVAIPEENEVYEVHTNPDYDKDETDRIFERNRVPKICIKYPQYAGPWYLDTSRVFN